MIDFTITTKDFPRWAGRMRQGTPLIKREIGVALEYVGVNWFKLARRYVPSATDTLAEGIYYKVTTVPLGGNLEMGDTVPYTNVVEEGRRSGAKMPPENSLLPWMEAMGMDEKDEFPLRVHIARDGIPPHPFLSRAFEEVTVPGGLAERAFREAVDRVVATMEGL